MNISISRKISILCLLITLLYDYSALPYAISFSVIFLLPRDLEFLSNYNKYLYGLETLTAYTILYLITDIICGNEKMAFITTIVSLFVFIIFVIFLWKKPNDVVSLSSKYMANYQKLSIIYGLISILFLAINLNISLFILMTLFSNHYYIYLIEKNYRTVLIKIKEW